MVLILEENFEKTLAQYGATSTQADQYFTDIDSNNDGVISNSELLTAPGNTGSDTETVSASEFEPSRIADPA